MSLSCFSRKTPPYASQHCVKFDCLDRKSLENAVIDFDNQLGAGSSGTVYSVTTPWGAILALKVVGLNHPAVNDEEDPIETYGDYWIDETREFLNEASQAKRMGKLGVGPRVFDSWICDDVDLTYISGDNTEVYDESTGFILMEKIEGMTLLDYAKQFPDYFKQNSERIETALESKVDIITREGLETRDQHAQNIMVKFQHPTVVDDVVFVDFGDVHKDTQADNSYIFKLVKEELEMI